MESEDLFREMFGRAHLGSFVMACFLGLCMLTTAMPEPWKTSFFSFDCMKTWGLGVPKEGQESGALINDILTFLIKRVY